MPSRLKRGMKEELPEEEVEALLRWCGMAKGAAEQRKADESEVAQRPDSKRSESKRTDAAPAKVGHPYRRRLNSKGDRQG